VDGESTQRPPDSVSEVHEAEAWQKYGRQLPTHILQGDNMTPEQRLRLILHARKIAHLGGAATAGKVNGFYIHGNRMNGKVNPEARKARAKVQAALISGKLKRGHCKTCGAIGDILGHHNDYSKPYEVTWLCRKHHYNLHYSK